MKMKNKELLLEINYKCNLRCIHCSSIGCHNQKLSLDDVKAILKNSLPLINHTSIDEIEYVRISGGEPTLISNLKEYINFFHDNNTKVILQTNGTTDLTKFTEYENYPISEFWISLYGERNIHDFIVQKRGSYQKVFDNIKMLQNKTLSKIVIQSPIFNDVQLFSFGRIPNDINNRINLRLFALLNHGRCNFALPIDEQISHARNFYSRYKNYMNIDLTCSLTNFKCNYENKLVLKPDGTLFNCESHKHERQLCKK